MSGDLPPLPKGIPKKKTLLFGVTAAKARIAHYRRLKRRARQLARLRALRSRGVPMEERTRRKYSKMERKLVRWLGGDCPECGQAREEEYAYRCDSCALDNRRRGARLRAGVKADPVLHAAYLAERKDEWARRKARGWLRPGPVRWEIEKDLKWRRGEGLRRARETVRKEKESEARRKYLEVAEKVRAREEERLRRRARRLKGQEGGPEGDSPGASEASDGGARGEGQAE